MGYTFRNILDSLLRRRPVAEPATLASVHRDIERAQEVFQQEVAGLSQSFYAWKAINNLVSGDNELYRHFNANALTWNTITHSLQSYYLLALGRIFDIDSASFSVHALLRVCMKNLDQFSLEALKARKLAISDNADDWIDEYLEQAHVPSKQDFGKVKAIVKKSGKLYSEIYKPIRHEVIAHTDAARIDCVNR